MAARRASSSGNSAASCRSCSGSGAAAAVRRATTLRARHLLRCVAANSRKLRERYGRFDPAKPGKRQANPAQQVLGGNAQSPVERASDFQARRQAQKFQIVLQLVQARHDGIDAAVSASAGSIAWSDRSMTFSCGKFSLQQRHERRIAVKHAFLLQQACAAKHASDWIIFSGLRVRYRINPQPEPARGIDQNQQPATRPVAWRRSSSCSLPSIAPREHCHSISAARKLCRCCGVSRACQVRKASGDNGKGINNNSRSKGS